MESEGWVTGMSVFLLSEAIEFPPPRLAEKEGLLAIGGDLSVERLLLAYRMGIFPWFSDDQPILWWSPDPRLVLFPGELKVSRRLKRTINQNRFHITADMAFRDVMSECAAVRREKEEGTWIVDPMLAPYAKLHDAGYAHSIEAWQDEALVGGLYGISLGKCFFGESMFSRVSDASKVAFVALVEYLKGQAFDMVDCQVTTGHLMRFGAREIDRNRFLRMLAESLRTPDALGKWQLGAGESLGRHRC